LRLKPLSNLGAYLAEPLTVMLVKSVISHYHPAIAFFPILRSTK
jgi:hypothetical protein